MDNSLSLTPSTHPLPEIAVTSQPTSLSPGPAVAARPPASTLSPRQTNAALVRSGLLFLLKQKDRYGVWYSTRATINVLDAMLLRLQSASANSVIPAGAPNVVEISVNGQPLSPVTLSPDEFGNPISIDVTRFLRPSDNRLELRQASGLATASVQVVANYYVPWSAANVGESVIQAGASDITDVQTRSTH
jgi:hypothetical protein